MQQELENLTKQPWYRQAFTWRPFMVVDGCSIEGMQKGLGFTYKTLAISFKQDYCELNYLIEDLERIPKTVLANLEKDKNYLVKKKEQYEGEVSKIKDIIKTSDSKLTEFNDPELIAFAQSLSGAMDTTIGTAHLIEGLSLTLENELRNILPKTLEKKESNKSFSVLSTPTKQSFLSERDELLWEIKHASPERKEKLFKEFFEKFYWINANIAESTKITQKAIAQMADELNTFKKPDFLEIQKQKKELAQKVGFKDKENKIVSLIDFLTNWQDERKKNYLKMVYITCRAILEISKRFGIEERLLQYLLPIELNVNLLKDGTLLKTANERINGVVFIKKFGSVKAISGKEFNEFYEAMHKQTENIETISGMAASLGTATGPVKICTTLESIKEVNEGDVLVASMTRPEYVIAMKKAVAIVTDEGGVTCHAAIISRELGLPCIVGTKNATRILKDGWIVQVKANHGQVIVIEKQ